MKNEKSLSNSSGRRMRVEPSNDALSVRSVDDTDSQLRKMEDYPGALAIVINALKQKGMRFAEESFKNGDISNDNYYAVTIRGDAAKMLDRAFERVPSRIPTQ